MVIPKATRLEALVKNPIQVVVQGGTLLLIAPVHPGQARSVAVHEVRQAHMLETLDRPVPSPTLPLTQHLLICSSAGILVGEHSGWRTRRYSVVLPQFDQLVCKLV